MTHTGGSARNTAAVSAVHRSHSALLDASRVALWCATNASTSHGTDALNSSLPASTSRAALNSVLHRCDSALICGESVCSVHAMSSRAASTSARHTAGRSPCGLPLGFGGAANPAKVSKPSRVRSFALVST